MWGSERRLDDYLQGRVKAALDELDALDSDYLLSENEDVLVAALMAKHMPQPVSIDWDGVTRSAVTEVTLKVPDQFGRDKAYVVPASRLVLSFPISGTTDMLNYQASTFSMGAGVGLVSHAAVVLEVIERALTADTILARIDRVKIDLNQRASWANSDLINFKGTAELGLRARYKERKERILRDRAVENALDIPVRTAATARPPVPARRKQVTLEQRKTQASFVPEPVLDEAIYRDVLGAVHSWARSLERTPGTAFKLDEEELRDLLLGTLNGYWSGAAGGELFNGSGKTDILIRANDRNVFVGECKIWRGSKAAAEGIDQLLSYLVWRDSKAALIMFIKTADPSATIEKLNAAIEQHPRHVLTKTSTDPRNQTDYVITGDDEGRRVSLAVVPVVIRPADGA